MSANSCRCNKMRFDSEAAAKQYVRDLKDRSNGRNENMPKMNAYQCQHARDGAWHLTSMKKTEMRRYRKARGLA
jgi:hypothetical protein